MTPSIKNIVKIIVFISLLIPIVLGVYVDFWYIKEFNLSVLWILILGTISLYILGEIIIKYTFDQESLLTMNQHEVIGALLDRNFTILLVYFPITICIEELIFRYYIMGLMLNLIQLESFLSVILSSIIFSLYHIHIWFTFKNLRILLGYLLYSFLLGLFTAYFLLVLGLVTCIFLHFGLVFLIYIRTSKIIIKQKK